MTFEEQAQTILASQKQETKTKAQMAANKTGRNMALFLDKEGSWNYTTEEQIGEEWFENLSQKFELIYPEEKPRFKYIARVLNLIRDTDIIEIIAEDFFQAYKLADEIGTVLSVALYTFNTERTPIGTTENGEPINWKSDLHSDWNLPYKLSHWADAYWTVQGMSLETVRDWLQEYEEDLEGTSMQLRSRLKYKMLHSKDIFDQIVYD